MVAIDTNVVVRFLAGDDAAQLRAALKLFTTEQIFISDSVLLETEWVLRAAYELTRDEVCEAFRRVLGLPNVAVRDAREIAQVIDWHAGGMDFADAMHLAQSRDAESLRTFDKAFVKSAKSSGLNRVQAV